MPTFPTTPPTTPPTPPIAPAPPFTSPGAPPLPQTRRSLLKSHPKIFLALLALLLAALGGLIYYRIAILPKQLVVARDKKRVEDLKRMKQVYETFYAEQRNRERYPADCSNTYVTQYSPGGWPTDPLNTGEFVYEKNCSYRTYCFCTKLEGTAAQGGEKGNSTTNVCRFIKKGSAEAENAPYYCLTSDHQAPI